MFSKPSEDFDFIEFKISKTDNKQNIQKTSSLVDWKLEDIKSELPYSDAPQLQPNILKQNNTERLSSVNIFLRSDHLDPKTIILERKGFHPKPTISDDYGDLWKKYPDFILSIDVHRADSTYTGSISCTDSLDIIKEYFNNNDKKTAGNFIYMLKAAGAVTIGNGRNSRRDREYTLVGGVSAEDIIAFRQTSTTSSAEGFNGSSLYIRKSFLKKYGEDYLQRILSVYLEPNEVAIPKELDEKNIFTVNNNKEDKKSEPIQPQSIANNSNSFFKNFGASAKTKLLEFSEQITRSFKKK
ncbi:MAG: hypothetical protein JO131_05965 [Gammaproteobacteria bacterium]|nr:hypothetical protein [Gammaproteobacteria bacterium]